MAQRRGDAAYSLTLAAGDRIVLFDPLMLDPVLAQSSLREVRLPFASLDSDPVVVYRGAAPIIYLARCARLFEYV